MTTSDQINELATALAQAQSEMSGSRKDAKNDHFKSAYSTLASVRDATVPHLNAHGISVVQSPRSVCLGENQWAVEIETRLLHTSGQWMGDTLTIPLVRLDAQAVVSATTYGRRTALASFAGIAPADDDGEGAVGRTPGKVTAPKAPAGFEDWKIDLEAAAGEGLDILKKAWKASDERLRAHLMSVDNTWWELLKVRAKDATPEPAL